MVFSVFSFRIFFYCRGGPTVGICVLYPAVFFLVCWWGGVRVCVGVRRVLWVLVVVGLRNVSVEMVYMFWVVAS